jgi:transaldolase|tara:strand:+ start:1122 stop:1850 length:729 start_codon:yes stop_codon:yes gene_type:complete
MIDNLKIKIFADGADLESIKILNTKNYIKGFTTNPSLMKKAGIKDYKDFAIKLLSEIKDKPISFEVFSDDIIEMEKQAEEIASWGKNVNVKIPITNTKKIPTIELIRKLSAKGIICNITAIFTASQIQDVVEVLDKTTPAILSIFAGRIADTGIDPEKIVTDSINIAKSKPKSEILWASTRENLNIFQAERMGCHIITVPHDLLKKMSNIGKNLEEFSLETVHGFYTDALSAGYRIKLKNEI